jgi:arylsulfatase A-like enzyme
MKLHSLILTVAFSTAALVTAMAADGPNRALLIVVDGLRPDYITPELMPNLHALGERGVIGEAHTSVYPTYTRVNSASIATGSYPARHGLIQNTMWIPEMGDEPFSTGTAANIRRFMEATHGEMLTTVSVGEVLEEAGLKFLVCGSAGGGTSILQNHRGKGRGIWTARGLFVPPGARREAEQAVGETPSEAPEQTVWAFSAYLHHALSDDPPDFTLVWINEPDTAGHTYGVGAPGTIEALTSVDRQIGRILAAHEEHGLTGRINVFVSTDHGFTTSRGGFSIGRTLRDLELGDQDVTIVSNMIHLRQRDDLQLMGKIVETLQRDETVGNIYTRPARPGSAEGIIPGTLSTAVIQWDHDRSSDIIASPAWTDEVNEYGYAGATTRSGTATHGSDSPFDLHIRLLAAGPDIKQGLRSHVPTGNVDLIPTVLHLLGLEPPAEMDGRILREILTDGPAPETVLVHEHVHQTAVTFPDGFRYQAIIDTRHVGTTFYLRGARTERSPSTRP